MTHERVRPIVGRTRACDAIGCKAYEPLLFRLQGRFEVSSDSLRRRLVQFVQCPYQNEIKSLENTHDQNNR